MTVEGIIDSIIEVEGGYVDHPQDPGGPTKFGITEETARKWGFEGDMRDLDKETARAIYRKRYVEEPKFDRLEEVEERLAAEVVDTGVNMGPRQAAKFLQQALNRLNRNGALYDDVRVDGRIGDRTIHALESYLEERELSVLLKALNILQGAEYLRLSKMNPARFEMFTYGWLRHRIHLPEEVS